jgi:hypothetical protein
VGPSRGEPASRARRGCGVGAAARVAVAADDCHVQVSRISLFLPARDSGSCFVVLRSTPCA